MAKNTKILATPDKLACDVFIKKSLRLTVTKVGNAFDAVEYSDGPATGGASTGSGASEMRTCHSGVSFDKVRELCSSLELNETETDKVVAGLT